MTTSLFLCAAVIGNFSGFDLGPAPRIFTKLLKFQCHYLLRKFAINKPENRGLKMAKETLINSYINLNVNYSNLTRSKIKEIDFKLQKQDCQPQTSTIGSNHSGQYSMFNSPAGSTSIFTDEVSAAAINPSTESQLVFQIYNLFQSGLNTKVTMVGQQLRYFSWELNYDPAIKTVVIDNHADWNIL